MEAGNLFMILFMILVFFAFLYGIVRAAVISGMKEYYEEKEFNYLKTQKGKDQSNLK